MIEEKSQTRFWRNRRVAVPGGAGFIGSYLCDHLVQMGARVTVIDSLARGSLENLGDSLDQLEFIQADVRDTDLLDRYFAKTDAVINMAGVAPGLYQHPDRDEFLYRANIEIGESVLKSVIRNRVSSYLLVSSSCVYPDDAPVPTPELSIEEGLPESANLGYGNAKRDLERRAIETYRSFPELSLAIARPFNVYGSRDLFGGVGGHVIPSLLARVLSEESEELWVWGSGRQTRSFLHGRDAARALALVAAFHAVGDPVNVGTDEESSMTQICETLLRLTASKKTIRYDLTKPEGALRKGADTRKLRRVTGGFAPEVVFEEGLREMVEASLGRTVEASFELAR